MPKSYLYNVLFRILNIPLKVNKIIIQVCLQHFNEIIYLIMIKFYNSVLFTIFAIKSGHENMISMLIDYILRCIYLLCIYKCTINARNVVIFIFNHVALFVVHTCCWPKFIQITISKHWTLACCLLPSRHQWYKLKNR